MSDITRSIYITYVDSRAFPTIYYQDYPSSYTICGTLPTSFSGVATCIEHKCVNGSEFAVTHDGAPSFAFPSHPPIPWPKQTISNFEPDLQGLTYEPAWDSGGDWSPQLRPLFPDLAAWSCYVRPLQAPDTLKLTALYLTATSTATESGDVPSRLPIPTGTQLPIYENGASQAPIITLGPLATKPEEAATSLPSLRNAPESTTATRATSIIEGLSSNQMPPNRPTDSATMSLGVAAGHANAPTVDATSPTRTFSFKPAPMPLQMTTPSALIAPLESPGQAAAAASSAIPVGSTDKHSNVIASMTPLSAVIFTSTNQQGSFMVTTSADIPGGSSTTALAAIPTPAAAQALSIGTQVLTANSENQYVVGTQTLGLGVPITVGTGDAATPIILYTSSSHSILVIGSNTQTLPASPTPQVLAAPATLNIGSQTLVADSAGQYVAGTQTLAPGSPITLGSGDAATPILLRTTNSNTLLIIGSSTSTLTVQTPLIPTSITPTLTTAASATTPPPFTIGTQIVTANSQHQYIVGTQTLIPGVAITVSGTPVSLAPSGTQILVGTSTDGLGNFIMSGLGAGPGSTVGANASGVVPFTAAAAVGVVRSLRWLVGWGGVVIGVGVMVWL